jgi:hypothetical protein
MGGRGARGAAAAQGRVRTLCWALFTALGLHSGAAAQAPAPATAPPAEDPGAVVDRLVAAMVSAERATKTWTFVLERQELVDGEMMPAERMQVSFQKPFAVYAKWIGAVDNGQELIFKKGWNGDQLMVNPPGLVPTLNLDPRGAVAMRGNRHPILDLGFPFLVGRIAADHQLARAHPGSATVEDLGPRTVSGRAARCYRSTLPKDQYPSLYAYKAEICVDTALNLPTEVKVWDKVGGSVQLVERYTFSAVKVNPSLDPLTFDPENPAYGF